ncbi:MAG: prephenate dehydrogenase/arogenate dehydrogenase family protein [Acidobacteriota bacterium]|nr:prephenate dehydrogenase/arogenate dehydrogenase family protein [Acidobacteriota bacterium]
MSAEWKRITVVGCGLVGASFALSVKERGAGRFTIAGWDTSAQVLEDALARGVIDEVDYSFAGTGSRLSDAAFLMGDDRASDLIYLAMPVRGIIDFLKEQGPTLRPGIIVTDAGSTKAEVCDAAVRYVSRGAEFIGGHPIAGSHRAGLASASAGLFRGAPYILTPANKAEPTQAFVTLKELIELLCGARVFLMSPAEHDRAMALVSHLPQVVSGALAATINRQSNAPSLIEVAGNGYRDMTRLSDSAWSVWRDILITNPGFLAEAVDSLVQTITDVRDELRNVTRAQVEAGQAGADDHRDDHRLAATRKLFK